MLWDQRGHRSWIENWPPLFEKETSPFSTISVQNLASFFFFSCFSFLHLVLRQTLSAILLFLSSCLYTHQFTFSSRRTLIYTALRIVPSLSYRGALRQNSDTPPLSTWAVRLTPPLGFVFATSCVYSRYSFLTRITPTPDSFMTSFGKRLRAVSQGLH